MDKEIIKYLRKKYKMTQREFATAISCSYSLIALVELGKRRVTTNLENKVKDSFNLTDDQLTSISSLADHISKGMPPFI
jgi:transcriptional regulator with XRE-family HTH domain